MNNDQKREEAISNLIKELTTRKIYSTSIGVVRGYPTLRIYDHAGQDRIADIYVMGTNSDVYVYAIDPLTSKFREQLKNNKYNCVYTEPSTNNWYIFLTPSGTACVIKDFLEMSAPDPEPKIFDKLYAKEVIFNDPATIVIWADGSKTVVKANDEKFDPEKGLAMAISKKVLGNKHDYYDIFKKYVGRYEKKQKKGGVK